MVSQTTLLILGGCMLGAIQLIAGVAIGLWFRRMPRRDAHSEHHTMLRTSLIADRLRSLAGEMSSNCNAHRNQLSQASQVLTADDIGPDDSITDLVVNVVANIVRSNQNLQSQLETAEHRLEEQAAEIECHISRSLTDPLTGLPNRREFNERLEERMAAWNRRREVFSLLLVDVDHFKQLNDEYGHLAGDQVLAAVGRILRAATRRDDAVARYGGEEFAALLPNTSLEQAKLVAEKVREAVARAKIRCNSKEIAVTVSGGLAAIEAGDVFNTLIQKADIALYAAKAAGRNCICVYDGSELEIENMQDGRLMSIMGGAGAEEISSAGVRNGVENFLQRDMISVQLAEACDELRRYVAERKQREAARAAGNLA